MKSDVQSPFGSPSVWRGALLYKTRPSWFHTAQQDPDRTSRMSAFHVTDVSPTSLHLLGPRRAHGADAKRA